MTKRALDHIPVHDQRAVGVDSSAGSADALLWAYQFAARTGRRLRLITSWSYPSTAALPGGPHLQSAIAMDEATAAKISEPVLAEIRYTMKKVDLLVQRGPDFVGVDGSSAGSSSGSPMITADR